MLGGLHLTDFINTGMLAVMWLTLVYNRDKDRKGAVNKDAIQDAEIGAELQKMGRLEGDMDAQGDALNTHLYECAKNTAKFQAEISGLRHDVNKLETAFHGMQREFYNFVRNEGDKFYTNTGDKK